MNKIAGLNASSRVEILKFLKFVLPSMIFAFSSGQSHILLINARDNKIMQCTFLIA